MVDQEENSGVVNGWNGMMVADDCQGDEPFKGPDPVRG